MENLPKRKYNKSKEGYTVSVTYFLRKEADFLEKFMDNDDSESDTPKFPLYIRVAFLQQNVKIRSRLMVKLTDNNFDDYMALPFVEEFVHSEIAAIKYSVQEFNPDQKQNFRISEWSNFYKNGNDDLSVSVEDILTDRLIESMKNTVDILGHERALLAIASGGLSLIWILASMGLKPALSLYNEFRPIFDIITPEDSAYRGQFSHKPEYTSWDWKVGTYQAMIEKKYRSKSKPLLSLLENILS
ncbi:hypothetical protein [Spirosoma flavum]|uniref:Uncharacterized protein n=1 Tax=Spirosoma flavum TaxID=2048557 RepID=A0ABW6AP54_9BACT